MKFIPSGSNASFYLGASGTNGGGSYVLSHYQSLLNGTLPFSGVQIGPQLYVSKGALVNGLLNETTSDTNPLPGIGLYVDRGIKTGQYAEGYQFRDSSYSASGDSKTFDVVNSSNLGNTIQQILNKIA
jgi:hypothetical protein